MWILFAFGSAIFAGATAILAKCGVKNIDSNVATAFRTSVVLVFSWIMVMVTGNYVPLNLVDSKTMIFLILSGLATGGSWLCYFKALQSGDVNKVTPIDKSSTVLTMAMTFIFLGEAITKVKVIAMVLIGIGTYMMIQKKETCNVKKSGNMWLIYALASAVFASLTSILGKIGVNEINSTLATAIRTIVVLIMAWIVVFIRRKHKTIKLIDKKSLIFLVLSGFATGASWLCYYHALKFGVVSIVVPIDKLSILITIAFAYIVFREKLTKKSAIGLALNVAGTLSLLI